MNTLKKYPLKIYKKTTQYPIFDDTYGRQLKLFRVRHVDDSKTCNRCDLFHAPYDKRGKVSSSRYSIAGHPSLYLGTSLELCCEELGDLSSSDKRIASRFEIIRDQGDHKINVNVIELGRIVHHHKLPPPRCREIMERLDVFGIYDPQ